MQLLIAAVLIIVAVLLSLAAYGVGVALRHRRRIGANASSIHSWSSAPGNNRHSADTRRADPRTCTAP